jgi:hypothetical protein
VYIPAEDVNVNKMLPLKRVVYHGYHHYSNRFLAIPTRRLELHLEHRLYYRAIEQLHDAVEIGVGIFGSNMMDGKSMVDTNFIKVKIPRLSHLPPPEAVTSGVIPESNRTCVELPSLSAEDITASKSISVLQSLRVVCHKRRTALEVDIVDEYTYLKRSYDCKVELRHVIDLLLRTSGDVPNLFRTIHSNFKIVE